MIVVSQEFHNERALAIAAHEEMDAWAVSAPDVPNRSSRIKSWFRERAARVWMMLDLWLWGREPPVPGGTRGSAGSKRGKMINASCGLERHEASFFHAEGQTWGVPVPWSIKTG